MYIDRLWDRVYGGQFILTVLEMQCHFYNWRGNISAWANCTLVNFSGGWFEVSKKLLVPLSNLP